MRRNPTQHAEGRAVLAWSWHQACATIWSFSWGHGSSPLTGPLRAPASIELPAA
eukprot:CAMPEP_0181223954 /NCGR_PEP_ID=MMETSP1096-20121128/30845_1 /TAXON_ID=156174 ORGANISM="Chrysochromulina ericina, Strain CCMP281" /NCGR_SAMPLE_ID=MMETSP1096 /ASSEMBLY_ACC=CAM_ASM_000453 /LENGTH=53 /DNA_ID=CAMNT_0023316957 /DNA_START=309 /DNA_END=466 /DNA_ORIENTATION=-